MSPHFVNKYESMEVELDRPFVLIHEKKISAIKDLIPLLPATSILSRSLAARPFR